MEAKQFKGHGLVAARLWRLDGSCRHGVTRLLMVGYNPFPERPCTRLSISPSVTRPDWHCDLLQGVHPALVVVPGWIGQIVGIF